VVSKLHNLCHHHSSNFMTVSLTMGSMFKRFKRISPTI
jgi:hypothetical protein